MTAKSSPLQRQQAGNKTLPSLSSPMLHHRPPVLVIRAARATGSTGLRQMQNVSNFPQNSNSAIDAAVSLCYVLADLVLEL